MHSEDKSIHEFEFNLICLRIEKAFKDYFNPHCS
jgi:hypothetical protein